MNAIEPAGADPDDFEGRAILVPKKRLKDRGKEQAAAEGANRGYLESFWDLNASGYEWLLLLFGMVSCAALHLTPVLQSSLAVPMTAAMAFFCYCSPVSAFFFLGCNQFLPYADGATLNPAQIGSVVWLPAALVRYRKVDLKGFKHFVWMVPWLGWHTLMTGENLLAYDSDYLKAFAYAVIGLQMANEAKGRYLLCVLALACGSLMVGFAYWGLTFGLPLQVSDWGGEREGFQRMGSVRADAVMVWPALLMGFAGILGIAGSFGTSFAKRMPPWWLVPAVLVAAFVTLPPLAATMTHGAFAGLGIIVVVFLAAMYSPVGKKGVDTSAFRARMNALIALLAVGAVGMYAVDAFGMRSRTEALSSHFESQSGEMGAAASRTDVWGDAIDTILTYPLTGYRFVNGKERITSHYASEGGYLAHSVFLDYGRYGGIPGLVFTVMFLFAPAWRLWRHPDRGQFTAFFMLFVAVFTFWMVLSFQFYKTVWSFWALMMVASEMPSEKKVKLVEEAEAEAKAKAEAEAKAKAEAEEKEGQLRGLAAV